MTKTPKDDTYGKNMPFDSHNKAPKVKADFAGNNRPIKVSNTDIQFIIKPCLDAITAFLLDFSLVHPPGLCGCLCWLTALEGSNDFLKGFPHKGGFYGCWGDLLGCVAHWNSAVMLPPTEDFTNLTFAAWLMHLQLWKQDLNVPPWAAERTPDFPLDLSYCRHEVARILFLPNKSALKLKSLPAIGP